MSTTKYQVTAPLVIVPDDEGRDIYLYEGAVVPATADSKRVKQLADEGMLAPLEEVQSAAQAEPPAGNASFDEWHAYALTRDGVTEESIDGLGRDELREQFGPKS